MNATQGYYEIHIGNKSHAVKVDDWSEFQSLTGKQNKSEADKARITELVSVKEIN